MVITNILNFKRALKAPPNPKRKYLGRIKSSGCLQPTLKSISEVCVWGLYGFLSVLINPFFIFTGSRLNKLAYAHVV